MVENEIKFLPKYIIHLSWNCSILYITYFSVQQIYAPNDKKSFMSVTGEWSGLMESKYNNTDGPKQVMLTIIFIIQNK